MATFELNSDKINYSSKTAPGSFERSDKDRAGKAACPEAPADDTVVAGLAESRIRQESVIALKIYDSCRHQDCLDCDELGPARSAGEQELGGKRYRDGEIIDPPDCAASVSVDCLRVKKIIIVDKRHNPFKRGFWDVDLKYVFEYCLVFREASGDEIGCLKSNSIFNKRVTLFGSVGSDIVISTDLFSERNDESPALSLDPFVLVEAKPVPLAAKLKYSRQRYGFGDCADPTPNEVIVTIGLFTIIKLYRIVTLMVESRGFGIPNRCEEYSPINVCDYFEKLPFPMDVFAPPQRREFESGVSGDIPPFETIEFAEAGGQPATV